MQEGGYYMRWTTLVTSLFFTFLVAPALASHDLYTGHSLTGGSTEETICIITNVDSKPIEATAVLLDSFNSSAVPGQQSVCPTPPATLDPGRSCSANLSNFNTDEIVYCHFTTSSSKVRASWLQVTSSFETRVSLPATK
jgi:hypothetical protein